MAAAAAVAATPKAVWGKVDTASTSSVATTATTTTTTTIASSPVDLGYPSLGASTAIKDNSGIGPSSSNASASTSSTKQSTITTKTTTSKNGIRSLIANSNGLEDDGSKGKKM